MKKPTPIRPMGMSVNDSLTKRIANWVLNILLCSVFAAFLAVMLIEWMAGCGESYVDANGVRHQHECVFLTVHNEGEKQ